MTIKESFNLAGYPTTWGYPEARDYRPAEDALIVNRAKAAGAVILGKTNVPPRSTTRRPTTPSTGSPTIPTISSARPGARRAAPRPRSPRASVRSRSGPISVARCACRPISAGSSPDKPTLNLVPGRGQTPPLLPSLPYSDDLAVVGPMTRTADDLIALFDAIAGPDELTDGVGYRLALPPPRSTTLAGARVLVLARHPLGPTDAPVAVAVEALAAGLEKAGAKVSRASALLPDLDAATRTYLRILNATIAAFMPEDFSPGSPRRRTPWRPSILPARAFWPSACAAERRASAA